MTNWPEYIEFGIKALAVAVPVCMAGLRAVTRIERTTMELASKVEVTTHGLASSIDHLTQGVVRLDTVLSHTQRDVATIKERLVVVETLAKMFQVQYEKSN